MFFAVVAMFVLPVKIAFVPICPIPLVLSHSFQDFPETTSWLSDEERRLAIYRMKEDVGIADTAESEPAKWSGGLVDAVTDWRVWWLAVALTAELLALSFNCTSHCKTS